MVVRFCRVTVFVFLLKKTLKRETRFSFGSAPYSQITMKLMPTTLYQYNIFTGRHGGVSPRGNIVDRGGAEVDNALRGVTIYHVIPVKNEVFILL